MLDLSRVLSGPSCAKALADLGADVVKLEPPEGDLTRTAQPRANGVAVYFAQQNCGKRCVSVDIRDERGRDLALGLAAASDVVVENFRPGVLDRLGLGYDAVRERNPRVIYCSITGYGREGEMASRRAYAPVIHAELGLTEFVARRQRADPRSEAVSHADLYSGFQAALGVVTALYHRERTGEGQHIDVAMAEVMLQATEWTAVELAGGEGGRFHVFGGFNAPLLRLGDGSVACVPGDPIATFPNWCKVMEREDLLEDPRFATHADRDRNRPAMYEVLQDFASSCSSFAEFEAAIGRVRMAAGKVTSLADAVEAPWARERGVLVDVGTSDGPVRLPRSPFRFSATDAGTSGTPAWQGQHNREVLEEVLGLGAEDVAALQEAGVLVERAPEPG